MNTAGQIAAIVLQPVAGYSTTLLGNWSVPLWLIAALDVMGAACWVFVEPLHPVLGGQPVRCAATRCYRVRDCDLSDGHHP